jgi:VIT1/CCC1 family predicted Fe2+/Mn2+ transporter|tara:strand:+ start:481 stop:723 length:243 start_codon:yes stop_codon:yes gene_type:complete
MPVDTFNDMMYGMYDMTQIKKSSLVDMIMVQVISLTLGAFLLIAFSAYEMSQNELMYSMAVLFVSLLLTGTVYRRLGEKG